MITADGINYEVVGIAFPKTNAYGNMWISTGGPLRNLSTGTGKAIYSFPWDSFGIETIPCETDLIKSSYDSKIDTLAILEKSASALKNELLDPLKPKILELQKKNYSGLEGIILGSECNAYPVSAITNLDKLTRSPLEMLKGFKTKTYLNLNDDLNALNRLETESARDNFRNPDAFYGFLTFNNLSKLAKRMDTKKRGETELWLYGRDLNEGYNVGIGLLDTLYSLRTPLEVISA